VTLAGYFIYIEYKGEEFRKQYQQLLGKVKAGVYSKYITIEGLDAKIENTGALKGKPVIEGVITNKGGKDALNLAIKVGFLDKDGAVIYETAFIPQEPPLSDTPANYINIPYLRTSPGTVLKAGERFTFKRIMSQCPTEIFVELREGNKPRKGAGRWSGTLTARITSLDF
jgi:hypothetical protein